MKRRVCKTDTDADMTTPLRPRTYSITTLHDRVGLIDTPIGLGPSTTFFSLPDQADKGQRLQELGGIEQTPLNQPRETVQPNNSGSLHQIGSQVRHRDCWTDNVEWLGLSQRRNEASSSSVSSKEPDFVVLDLPVESGEIPTRKRTGTHRLT